MRTISDLDKDMVAHTVEAIGRTGAVSLEIGWLDDTPPHRWYATAQYRGAKVSCDNQPDIVAAVLGLYAMLAAGGECTGCGHIIALDQGVEGLKDGARMRRGVFETHRADPAGDYCVRRLELDGWTTCDRRKADA